MTTDDALPQHDQREQPVALGDVPGMPRRAARRGTLGEGGHEHFADAQDVEDPQRRRLREEQPHHPADLQDADAGRVAQGSRPGGGVARGGPEPLRHHGDAHDDVADRHDGEVAGGEGAVDAGGEDQDADDLHEGQQAVQEVVDVVGRGEPGEVDPGPPDGEEDQEVADDGRVEVAGTQGGVELGGRLRDRHHEAEVEQQLERGRGPVLLGNVPWAHRAHQERRPAASSWGPAVSQSAAREVGRGPPLAAVSLRTPVIGDLCSRTYETPSSRSSEGFREESRRRPTLPGGLPQVHHRTGWLAADVFGMGAGVARRHGLRKSCTQRGTTVVELSTDRATLEAAFPQPLSVPKRARASRSPSPRPISTGRLNALLHLHLRPINVVV